MKFNLKRSIFAATFYSAALSIVMSCSPQLKSSSTDLNNDKVGSTDQSTPKTIIPSAIDSSVEPCEDFYQYACGHWLSNFKLPSDRTSYFMKGSSIEDKFIAEMQQILKNESDKKTSLGKVYSSCVNRDQHANDNLTALNNYILELQSVKNIDSFVSKVGEFQRRGVKAFFAVYTFASYSDSNKVIPQLWQNSFTLPEKHYYFEDSNEMKMTRQMYLTHIEKMLDIVYPDQKGQLLPMAQRIFQLETQLAQNSLTVNDVWNPSNSNHPTTFEKLKSEYPINLQGLVDSIGYKNTSGEWNISSPDYFKYLTTIFKEENLELLKEYLTWKIIHDYATATGGDLEAENFAFWSKYLNGQEIPQPKEKSCLSWLESYAADNVSLLFLENHPEAVEVKLAGAEIVERIKDAFLDNLNSVSWLSEKSKLRVIEKVKKMTSQISFGDKYKPIDLSQLTQFNFLEISTSFSEKLTDKSIHQVGLPPDRDAWWMQPYQDNAYYSREENKVVLPFTNWVPPYFDLNGQDAGNLGSIAYVGHELTHGFDKGGSQYDENGNVSGWWSEQETKEFEKRNQCYIDQANAYKVKQGWNVKGETTIDENVADQAGVKLAYMAYAKKLKNLNSADRKKLDRDFFISYAQSWCIKQTDENIFANINSDSHTPSEFRVNGVMMNQPEFAQAFNCSSKARLNPEIKCKTW